MFRVLTKGSSAEVQIALRGNGGAGHSSAVRPMLLEPFSQNKEMGRILIRRGGETIAAGVFKISFFI
jgi:elongation factor 1 alpha-like protein